MQLNAPQATAEIFAAALEHSQAGRLVEAVTCFRKAVQIAPDFAVAHYNLGNALAEQGQLDAAIVNFHKTIELAPGLAEAYSNLGAVLKQQGRLDEAMMQCRKAVELAPKLSVANFNLATILEELRQLEEAIAYYRKAIDLKPDFAVAHLNLAMALLALGEMTEGWQEHEWRWRTPQMADAKRIFLQPQWRGEAAAGRILLIHAEQGFGDTIQFCRYAPLAAARGFRVLMEVPKQLARLLQCLPGVDLIIDAGEPLPPFDVHSPMMSLPWAMGTTMATIPDASPYLHLGAAAIESWRHRLAATVGDGPRIGLVWAGNSRKDKPGLVAINKRRSIALERLAPLFKIPKLNFFSLQKDEPAGRGILPLIEPMAEVEDFLDTAALIANLDLIISVDTAVAHLAGAIGKPVWLLNRFDSDWRWLVGRRDSPWYPTLRLYHQPQPSDWGSVIAEIAHDLLSLSEKGDFQSALKSFQSLDWIPTKDGLRRQTAPSLQRRGGAQKEQGG